MKIDFHAHYFPAEFYQAVARFYPSVHQAVPQPDGTVRGNPGGVSLPPFDLSWYLADMDEAAVDIEILSCPPIYNHLDDHLPELCRLINDGLAEVCRGNPKRLRAFAHLPFNDIDAALKELERVFGLPGFVGVCVASNIGGHYLDEPRFAPFWAAAARRGVPVFMHPINSPCYHDSEKGPVLEYVFDSTLAITRLITRGLYERHPDLTLIVSHLGGTLPYLASRLDVGFHWPDQFGSGWSITHPPSEDARRLYFDTGMSWHAGSYQCAIDVVGVEHLVLGTDHFMQNGWMKRTLATIEKLDLKPAERELIYHGNAERIVKLL